MKRLILLLALLFVAFPALAQDRGMLASASLGGRACVNYFTGKSDQNGFLLTAGFQQKSSKFVRASTNFGLTGHTDLAEVRFSKRSCFFRYGSNRDAVRAMDAFAAEFAKAGFEEVQFKSGGRMVTGYRAGDKIFEIGGSSGTAYSAFFTEIYAEIRR